MTSDILSAKPFVFYQSSSYSPFYGLTNPDRLDPLAARSPSLACSRASGRRHKTLIISPPPSPQIRRKPPCVAPRRKPQNPNERTDGRGRTIVIKARSGAALGRPGQCTRFASGRRRRTRTHTAAVYGFMAYMIPCVDQRVGCTKCTRVCGYRLGIGRRSPSFVCCNHALKSCSNMCNRNK